MVSLGCMGVRSPRTCRRAVLNGVHTNIVPSGTRASQKSTYHSSLTTKVEVVKVRKPATKSPKTSLRTQP